MHRSIALFRRTSSKKLTIARILLDQAKMNSTMNHQNGGSLSLQNHSISIYIFLNYIFFLSSHTHRNPSEPKQCLLPSKESAQTLRQIAFGRCGFEREHGPAAGRLRRFARMCYRTAARRREFQTS